MKPARKAPASLLKPDHSPSAASATPQATAKSSSSSCERAISATRRGSTQRIRAAVSTTTTASRSSSCSATSSSGVASAASPPGPPSPPVARSALISTIASTTARSCTMRKPTAMRPCRLSSSRLSDSSLTMMMVLEKVSATATYSASSQPLPRASVIRKPMTMVKASWPRPVASATGPMWRTWCRSSFRPTANSSTATPTWASRSIWSCAVTMPSTAGPATMPTTRYAISTGWRARTASAPAAAVTMSSSASSAKALPAGRARVRVEVDGAAIPASLGQACGFGPAAGQRGGAAEAGTAAGSKAEGPLSNGGMPALNTREAISPMPCTKPPSAHSA